LLDGDGVEAGEDETSVAAVAAVAVVAVEIASVDMIEEGDVCTDAGEFVSVDKDNFRSFAFNTLISYKNTYIHKH
jgi:hypothetical protein